jgi:hypothetical protein
VSCAKTPLFKKKIPVFTALVTVAPKIVDWAKVAVAVVAMI